MMSKSFGSFLKIPTRQLLMPNIQQTFIRKVTLLSDYEIQYSFPRVVKSPPVPIPLYGGRNTVTMIPGHGVGPEHAKYVREIFKCGGVPVDFEVIDIDANRADNTDLNYALMTIKRNGVAIKGVVDTNIADIKVRLANVGIRNDLDLYAYLLWCKSYPGIRAKYQGIDVVVVRENTEGEYSMLEHSLKNGLVESLKIITAGVSYKLARFAFDFARKNNRKKVTIVHKANIMKYSDGLFLKVCRQVAKEYSEIEHNDIIIDNCCMQLVTNPHQFDIIVTPNLYGSVVSSVLCGLAGGPGLMSGRNYGDHYAVFEPGARNTAAEIAKKNTANPVAMINAAVDMLYHLGHTTYAQNIEQAVYKTLTEDKIHTQDIGGTATSNDVVNKIIDYVCIGAIPALDAT